MRARGGLHFVIVVFIEYVLYRCYTEVLLRERDWFLMPVGHNGEGEGGGGGGGGRREDKSRCRLKLCRCGTTRRRKEKRRYVRTDKDRAVRTAM